MSKGSNCVRYFGRIIHLFFSGLIFRVYWFRSVPVGKMGGKSAFRRGCPMQTIPQEEG